MGKHVSQNRYNLVLELSKKVAILLFQESKPLWVMLISFNKIASQTGKAKSSVNVPLGSLSKESRGNKTLRD